MFISGYLISYFYYFKQKRIISIQIGTSRIIGYAQLDMKCKIFLGTFIFTCVAFLRTDGQSECRPGIPRTVYMHLNFRLQWEPPLPETCEIAYYIVRIIEHSDPPNEWRYEETGIYVNVSHLDECTWFTFLVSAVSTDGVEGSPGEEDLITPPPSEVDMEIDYLSASSVGRDIYLQWGLLEDWTPCAYLYRVVTYNEEEHTIVGRYTNATSMTITDIIPCGQYRFEVSALFNSQLEGPRRQVRYVAPEAETAIPNLLNLNVTSTSMNLTLELDSVKVNRCPIYNIDVDASPWFNASYEITDQEKGRLSRSVGVTFRLTR
ncbi:hypothetical protein NQ317_012792, partial [Molorchus minor]